jgi:hypothetical protein
LTGEACAQGLAVILIPDAPNWIPSFREQLWCGQEAEFSMVCGVIWMQFLKDPDLLIVKVSIEALQRSSSERKILANVYDSKICLEMLIIEFLEMGTAV